MKRSRLFNRLRSYCERRSTRVHAHVRDYRDCVHAYRFHGNGRVLQFHESGHDEPDLDSCRDLQYEYSC